MVLGHTSIHLDNLRINNLVFNNLIHPLWQWVKQYRVGSPWTGLWVSLCAAVWLKRLHGESQPTFWRLSSLKIFSMINTWVTTWVVVLRQLNSLFFSDNIKCSNTIFFSFFLFLSFTIPSSLANRTPKSLLITNNMGFHTLLEQVKFLWRLNFAQIDFNEGISPCLELTLFLCFSKAFVVIPLQLTEH